VEEAFKSHQREWDSWYESAIVHDNNSEEHVEPTRQSVLYVYPNVEAGLRIYDLEDLE
jgi:hypothetical protein